MIVLLLLISSSAASSSNNDLKTFLDQTLIHFQNETLGLVNINDEAIPSETLQVVGYRMNFPLETRTFSQSSVRECSLVLIEASHINSVRFSNRMTQSEF